MHAHMCAHTHQPPTHLANLAGWGGGVHAWQRAPPTEHKLVRVCTHARTCGARIARRRGGRTGRGRCREGGRDLPRPSGAPRGRESLQREACMCLHFTTRARAMLSKGQARHTAHSSQPASQPARRPSQGGQGSRQGTVQTMISLVRIAAQSREAVSAAAYIPNLALPPIARPGPPQRLSPYIPRYTYVTMRPGGGAAQAGRLAAAGAAPRPPPPPSASGPLAPVRHATSRRGPARRRKAGPSPT